jgi:hypothetical protein
MVMIKIQTLETDPASETSPLDQAAVPPRYKTYSDPSENRTLYVLGFGVLGAILANTIVLIYVASFYGPG